MLGRDYAGQNCSIARTLEIVGERWTMLIVRDALLGYTRFDQFAERLSIAPNTLTARLNRLVDAGILRRRPYQERPLRHEYLLTRSGRDLLPVALELMRWGDAHLSGAGPPAEARHAGCGGHVGAGAMCASCGAVVDASDVQWFHGPGSSRPAGPRPVQPYTDD